VNLTLRQNALAWIVLIHVAVVSAEFLLLARRLEVSDREIEREYGGRLVSTLRGQIQRGELNAARILQWPGWESFADAVLLDRHLALDAQGAIRPQGLALNPLGAARRGIEFDEQGFYAAMQFALERGQPVENVEGGHVVPIDTLDGVWGACWFALAPDTGRTRRLAIGFLALLVGSTAVLAAGTFAALRRTVLDPVSQLSRAARAVAAGDMSVRVRAPDRRDELSELMRTFNSMIAQVEGFNARLAREVREATEQARRAEAAAMTQRRLAATGELAAGIAHEINNPLGGLSNAVERLRQEDLPREKRAQYFDLLASGLERIRQTAARLLRFTPRQSRRGPVAVVDPVVDAVSLVRHRAARQGVALAISDGERSSDGEPLPDELRASLVALPAIQGDAHEIGQALLNLLVNSLDALETKPAAGGRIDVVVRRVDAPALGPSISVEVKDNGPGVGPEELPRVSDLFYTTKEVGKGTGLGLAIVHAVALAHGGRVELASTPGEGFVARLILPIAPAA
jgi:signal transduction histidine kinase